MAALSRADPRCMYSWWWDSHISPKNSKWLRENLTDMDAKVKKMIKLIDEDADSFAKRAEMYFKKRPELMKLVEEFYRAYRALAERYDHATGLIRQTHKKMAETFPNQVPLAFVDDSPADSDVDPRTPQMSCPARALFDTDDQQKDVLDLSSSQYHTVNRCGAFADETDSAMGRNGLKLPDDLFGFRGHANFAEGNVRNDRNFHNIAENESPLQGNNNHGVHAQAPSESGREHESEKEILTLSEALPKLEADKDAFHIQHQQGLEIMSNQDSEVSCAQEDCGELSKQASRAESEVQSLKESLKIIEAEKKLSHLQYNQCLDRISILEDIASQVQQDNGELNERASKAAQEVHEMISTLKSKFLHTEREAENFSGRLSKAESEIETLKQAIARQTEEKESAPLKYLHCLDSYSSFEHKPSNAQKEAKRLIGEIDGVAKKFKRAEELSVISEKSNQPLRSVLEDMVVKMGKQSQELKEKQEELGRLGTCIQEEHLRFVEAETAFQTLHLVHSKTHEELRSMASELHHKTDILKNMETQNKFFQEEVVKGKEDNKSLCNLNLSLASSVKDMQNDILGFRGTKRKLEEAVDCRLDQRNALQPEIYCIKELNLLKKKHDALLEQVDAVSLRSECLKSSVEELQLENSNLKETSARERFEKIVLLEKLEILEQLLVKKALWENSQYELSAELDEAREKINALGESCQSILEERTTLADERDSLNTKLQVAEENLGAFSEKNIVLENALSNTYDELEGLKAKSKRLEDSRQLLVNETVSLSSEKATLIMQLLTAEQRLKSLEITYKLLEENFSVMEKKKESALCRVTDLQVSLDNEKKEYANLAQVSAAQLAVMEIQICCLEEEGQYRKKTFEEELDKTFNSHIEIFVLQRCVQDLKEKNISLLIQYQKMLEASKLFERTVSKLEQENLERQMEVKFLSNQSNMHQLLQAFNVVPVNGCGDKIGEDQACLNHIRRKLEDAKNSLSQTQDGCQQFTVQMSVDDLRDQLNCDIANGNNLSSQKEMEVLEPQHAERHLDQVQNDILPDAFSDLQDRIKVIERVVPESEHDALQEQSRTHAKLEAAIRQTELKSQCSCQRENVKPLSEICEADNGLLTKDMALAQRSECSSYGIGRQAEDQDQILELWETASHDGSIDLTVEKKVKNTGSSHSNKTVEHHHFDATKKQKNELPTPALLMEKELTIDKPEIPKKSTEPVQEENKMEILGRLNSNVQKLANLQIAVQDLERKVLITEKSKKSKAIGGCDTLKRQLEEADEVILGLFNISGRLMKSIEDSSFSSDGKSATELEKSGSTTITMKRISEQAHRVSEKIGRLQLEVKKIHFVLLKLDDKKESNGTTCIRESKRTVLRDYLNGGLMPSHRRKKSGFCVCVEPSTKGD